MKTLGVIGGLGRFAAPLFLQQLEEMAADPVPTVVCDFPAIPDRTGYLLGSNLRSPLPGLLWAGRELARQGVCGIAVPCVSAYCFYEELSEGIGVPVLNAVQETARYLRQRGVDSAGIMATAGTVSSGLFSRALMEEGIHPVIPGKQSQEQIDHLIYRNIKAGIRPELERFHTAEEALRRNGAEVVILGSPELSVLRAREHIGKGFLDVIRVLAAQAVHQCGGTIRQPYEELIL